MYPTPQTGPRQDVPCSPPPTQNRTWTGATPPIPLPTNTPPPPPPEQNHWQLWKQYRPSYYVHGRWLTDHSVLIGNLRYRVNILTGGVTFGNLSVWTICTVLAVFPRTIINWETTIESTGLHLYLHLRLTMENCCVNCLSDKLSSARRLPHLKYPTSNQCPKNYQNYGFSFLFTFTFLLPLVYYSNEAML